jgi:hypothetical protein
MATPVSQPKAPQKASPAPDLPEDDTLGDPVEDSLASSENAETSPFSESSSVMTARAEFHSLADWQALKSALSSSPHISSMKVVRLSKTHADIQLNARMTFDTLAQTLKTQGISLSQGATGPVVRLE